MPNQTFNLTIDVQDGWECTGEYREPISSEIYLTPSGMVASGPADGPYFILRRAWTPPAWLPIENWLYWNGEQWRITNRQPRPPGEGRNIPRSTVGSIAVDVNVLATLMGQIFTPPPNNHTMVYQL